MSPSQMTDYLSCPRKWWFRRIAGLPEEEKVDKWDFGNTLHEVCERYVSADDRGRDATGQPVNLYPEGWNSRGLSKQQTDLIQATVAKAMVGKEQVLRRMPEREVEVSYESPVIEGVTMRGKIDVRHPAGFEDHKSSARKWMLTAKKLAKDEKMLCYAYEYILWRSGISPDSNINMRFNYFSKDPGDVFVKPVAVNVKAVDVAMWWQDTVVPAAGDMLRMKKETLPADEWCKVEGPCKPNACKEYGGCKFALICTRVQKPAAYIKQINRINESQNRQIDFDPMTNIFNRKKRKNGAVAAPVASTPSKIQIHPGAVLQEAEASVALDGETQSFPVAPWAREGCTVCVLTPGMFNNEPCPACDKINGALGQMTSMDFEIVFNHTHLVYAGVGGTGEIALVIPEVEEIPAKPTKVESVTETVDRQLAESEARKEARKAVVDDEKAAKKAETAAKRKAKREAKKAVVLAEAAVEHAEVGNSVVAESLLDVTPEFPGPEEVPEVMKDMPEEWKEIARAAGQDVQARILYINCLPVGVKAVELSKIMTREGMDLAETHKKESYFDLVAYERRSMLAGCAQEIVGELPKALDVVVQSGDADVDAFTAAVRPFFDCVVVGTS